MESKVAQFGAHQVDVKFEISYDESKWTFALERGMVWLYIPASLKMIEVFGATREGCNGGQTSLIRKRMVTV